MKILVTGAAGFIGSYVSRALLSRGDFVIGIDDFNDYYDPALKEYRAKEIKEEYGDKFKLYRADIRDRQKMQDVFKKEQPEKIIHLAARAGVRASLEDPFIYQDTNVRGTLNLLELAQANHIQNFVFASSSSVYGGNKKVPFSEKDRVDNPVSPYAATKKAGELLCYTYHHLYKLPCICLRFFTVYGPAGRPDMALFKFSEKIMRDEPIEMYGYGNMERDFTFIDDIVEGVVASLDADFKYEIFNLGNSRPENLKYFISLIERALGKKAKIIPKPIQPGDVPRTFADVTKAKKLLGYEPVTNIEEGIQKFVDWYKGWLKIRK